MTEHRDDDGCSDFERRFVEAYMGQAHCNGAAAVRMVSPDVTDESARSMAYELLRRPRVRKALRAREEGDPLVAGRIERLRYLTRIVRGETSEMRYVGSRRGKGGKWEAVKTEMPPTIDQRMAACRDLAKAAGEHIPLGSGNEDDVNARIAALVGGMSVAQLFEALTTSEKGQGGE